MKKIIPLLIILLFLAFGCDKKEFKENPAPITTTTTTIVTTTTTATTTTTSRPTTSTTTTTTTKVAPHYLDGSKMLALVNTERTRVGVSELTFSDVLTEAAKIRALESCESFSHTRPNGEGFSTVLDGAGFLTMGENLAAGTFYTTIKEPFDGWMNSPGHYENMIHDGFGQIGIVGYFCPTGKYQYYWVQLFSD